LSRDKDTGELAFLSKHNSDADMDASLSGFALHQHGDLFLANQDENALVVVTDTCPDIVFELTSYEAALEKVEVVRELEKNRLVNGEKENAPSFIEISGIFVAASLVAILVQMYSREHSRNIPQETEDVERSTAGESQSLTADNGQSNSYRTEGSGGKRPESLLRN